MSENSKKPEPRNILCAECAVELRSDMGGFAKLVTGFLILCRCRFEKNVNVHFFRKLIAHRVCPNFSISGINLHRTTRLYFLADPKNIETKKVRQLQSLDISTSATSHECSFNRKSNRNRNQKQHFPLDSLLKLHS